MTYALRCLAVSEKVRILKVIPAINPEPELSFWSNLIKFWFMIWEYKIHFVYCILSILRVHFHAMCQGQLLTVRPLTGTKKRNTDGNWTKHKLVVKYRNDLKSGNNILKLMPEMLAHFDGSERLYLTFLISLLMTRWRPFRLLQEVY